MRSHLRPTDLTRWRNDFVGFAPLLDIVPKQIDGTLGGRIKLRPSYIQTCFEIERTGRDIVLKPRQVGFTTWELARDIWFFLTRPASRVVILCQSDTDHRPLKEIASKLRIMFEGLAASGIRIEVQNDATDTWIFGDGSLQIVEAGGSAAAAAKVGRGGTVHRLHVTELAFFEHAQITLNAILECVPNGGGTEISIESTANGAAGVFFERYKAAKEQRSPYKAHFFRWLDQPEYATPLRPGELLFAENEREHALVTKHGATAEQVKWARAKIEDKGADLFDQEYPSDEETCWLVAGRCFFDKDAIKRILAGCSNATSIERAGMLRIWEQSDSEKNYVIVADTSEGTGGDPSGAMVYDRATGDHVATLRGQFAPWDLGAALYELGARYNWALVVVERNNHGHSTLDSLKHGDPATKRAPYPNIFHGTDSKPGWNTTPVTRPAALDAFEPAVRNGTWTTRDRDVLGEMQTFVVHKDGKPAATSGAHDELVMISAIAWDVLRKPLGPPPLDDVHAFRKIAPRTRF